MVEAPPNMNQSTNSRPLHFHSSILLTNFETLKTKNHTTHSQKKQHNTREFAEMASMTMTSSFLGTTTAATMVSHSPATSRRRLAVVASASKGVEGEKVKLNIEAKKESNNGRRDLMFAAAAAAVCSAAGIAVAEVPKAGTAEARKFYAPICVTMPTAKVCHK